MIHTRIYLPNMLRAMRDPTTATSTEGGSGQRRWPYQTAIWIVLHC